MNCEIEEKLFKLKMEAEKEFKNTSLSAAVEPLGIETPQTHNIINEKFRAKRRNAEGKLKKAELDYQNHIDRCCFCKNKKV